MIGLRRLNTGEWNKPPVLTAATKLLFSQLGQKSVPVPLRRVVTIHNGRGLSAEERDQSGRYSVFAAGGRVGSHSETLTECPCVVIGRKGSAGKPSYAPHGGWVIDTAYYAQPIHPSELDCKYLYYALASQDFSDDIITTAIPGINRDAVYAHAVPVPPLEVQIACIEFLDAVAVGSPLPPLPVALSQVRTLVAKIEGLEKKIREAEGLRDLTLKEGEILRTNSGRQFFRACDGWEVVALHEVCSTIIDCLHSNPVYADDGIPTVRSPDVGWGKLLLDTAKRTGQAEYERRTSRGEPAQNDIILVREGGGTGKAAIVRAGEKFSLGQRVMMLRPDLRKVAPKFLLYQWLSPLIYVDQIAERMKGSASPHLNIGSLRQFKFHLPPLSEQIRLVGHLDCFYSALDHLNSVQTETSAELDAMLPAILDRAFRGEL